MSINLDSNFNYKNSQVDQSTGALISLDSFHSHIHRGKAFRYIQTIAALADNGFLYYEIIPLLNDMHLKEMRLWVSEGPVIVDLLKGVTLTTGGAALVGRNLNDTDYEDTGAPIVSGVTLKSNPTGISGGVSMFGDPLRFGISGVGVQSNESYISSQVETVMAAGKGPYLLRLQNLSGGAIDVSAGLYWYE